MSEPADRTGRAAWIGGAALGLVVGGVGASGVLPAGFSGLAQWLAWILPGLCVAPLIPAGRFRPDRSDAGLGALAGWGTILLVAGGVWLQCALGLGGWDPGGEGLVQSWQRSEDGALALDISAAHTLALLQATMVLGAPLWALPQGLGLAVWSAGAPAGLRGAALAVAVAGLMGAQEGLAVVPAALALGLWVSSLSGSSVWPTALGVAAMVGLPALGPLLASGGVGFASPLVWVPAGLGALGLAWARRGGGG